MSPAWVVAALRELDSEIIGTIFIEKVLKKRVYYPFFFLNKSGGAGLLFI